MNKMSIDFGNCMLLAVGDNERKFKCESLYNAKVIAANSRNTVEVDGKAVQFGNGTHDLSSIDKLSRPYIKEQILLSAYNIFGECNKDEYHYIQLALGCPLEFYRNNKEDIAKFETYLKTQSPIVGKVEGREVNVQLVSVKVMAEGFSTVVPLTPYFKEGQHVIIDVGLKTTDIAVVNVENGKVKGLVQSETINIALEQLYRKLIDNVKKYTGINDLSISEVDTLLKTSETIKRGRKGRADLLYILNNELQDTALELMNEISNRIGEFTHKHTFFIGGGSEKYIAALNDKAIDWTFNSIEIPQETAYFANAVGFLNLIK